MLSFLLVLLVIHGFVGGVADPAATVRLMPLGIPDPINALLLPGLLFAYLGLTIAWVVRLSGRAATVVALAPALVIAMVQALWWSVPYLGKYFGLESEWVAIQWTDRQDFFPWIASAHAAQYLWITSFYARASSDWHGQARYYLGALAAGSALWALPAFLFAPAAGELDWNFALLLGATVNIHHFILDGAIWKLRHMKIASVLIGSEVRGDGEIGGRGWVRPLVWSIAALGLVMALHSVVERYMIEPAARRRGDLVAVADSLDRQAWHGRGSAFARFKLGRAFMQAGDRAAAMAQFELSAGMEPRVESIKRLIAHYHRSRNRSAFVRSCDRLFELDHVPRPMGTLDVGLASQAEFERFSDVCIEVAQAARPLTRETPDATGGGGLDGSVRRRYGN